MDIVIKIHDRTFVCISLSRSSITAIALYLPIGGNSLLPIIYHFPKIFL